MWLYFNNKGQLITSLEHGSPARVGSTNFYIFAVVQDISEDNIDEYMATLKLFKPDLMGSSYPTLVMTNAKMTFTALDGEGDTGAFTGGDYYGFLFRFNEMVDNNGTETTEDDTNIVLLDTDGLWQAVINVISDSYNVQGTATFSVAGAGTEEPTTLDYDIITNQLVQDINNRALKTQTIATYNSYAAILLNLDKYGDKQMFYTKDTHKLYQYNKPTEETGELVEIGYFEVDSTLSTTSENPVQNKVITEALHNAIIGVYKLQGNGNIEGLNLLTKTADMNGDVFNMTDAGNLTDYANNNIPVQVGDNVVLVWNDGEWTWDKLGGSVDTSNLVTLNTDQKITSYKTIANDKELRFETNAGDDKYFYIKNSSNVLHIGAVGIATKLQLDSYLTAFVPTSTTQDLGGSSARWQNFYLTGTIDFGDNAIIKKDSSNRVVIQYNGNDKIKVGSTETYFANHIEPDAPYNSGSQSGYDLGRNGMSWRDAYIGRNLTDGTNSVTVAQLAAFTGAQLWKHEITLHDNDNNEFQFIVINNSSANFAGTLLSGSGAHFRNALLNALKVSLSGYGTLVLNFYTTGGTTGPSFWVEYVESGVWNSVEIKWNLTSITDTVSAY